MKLLLPLGIALCIALGCAKRVEPPALPTAALDRPMLSLLETSRLAVVNAPESAATWGRLGQAFHTVEFHAQARICYEHAQRLDPRSPAWPHLLGILQLLEQPDAAITNLLRAAELAGSQTDAPRFRLVQALVERGRHEEAMKHLQMLLAANPAHAGARLQLGRIQLARSELRNAVETIKPCLTNAYTGRHAALLLSQIMLRNGQTEAANQMSRRAASMPRPFDWPDPFLREVQSLRVDRQKLEDQVNGLLVQQRLLEAETALNRLLEVFPDNPEGQLLLGRLRFQQKQCAEAEAAFRRHLQLQPSSLNGTIQLGLALLCQQRWSDAAGVLRTAIAMKPDFAQAHYNLGFALSRAGNSSEAIASFREALRCSPGDGNSHTALAEELFKTGDTAQATLHVQRALELNPNDPKARALKDRMSGGR